MLATNSFDVETLLLLMALPPKGREELLRILREHPYMRDVLLGVGAALDPYPKCYRNPFITDDHLALLSDWMAVGNDMSDAVKHHLSQSAKKKADTGG